MPDIKKWRNKQETCWLNSFPDKRRTLKNIIIIEQGAKKWWGFKFQDKKKPLHLNVKIRYQQQRNGGGGLKMCCINLFLDTRSIQQGIKVSVKCSQEMAEELKFQMQDLFR